MTTLLRRVNRISTLCFLLIFWLLSADAINIDSLTSTYNNQKLPDTVRLQAIQALARDLLYKNPDSTILLANKQLELAKRTGENAWASSALTTIGGGYWVKGNYYQALEYYKQSLKIEQQIGNKQGVANSYNNIGTIYDEIGDYPKAVEYYQKSLVLKEELNDKDGLAVSYNNIGIMYDLQGNFDKALEYFGKSLALDQEKNNQKGIADNYGNIGMVYGRQGYHDKAIENYLKSLEYNEQLGDKRGLANTYNNLGNTYNRQRNYTKALEYFKLGLKLREELGDKRGLANAYNSIGILYLDKRNSNEAITWCNKGLKLGETLKVYDVQYAACGCLYEAHKSAKRYNNALAYLEHLQTLEDSLHKDETSNKLQQLEFASEMKLQQLEFKSKIISDSLKEQEEKLKIQLSHKEEVKQSERLRNIFMVSGIGILLLAGGLFSRLRLVRKSRAIIKEEKDRSDSLLLNILPEEIAKELKEKGRADARNFDAVTILFTDFKEFTQASEQLTAKELVEEINVCFEAFDKIIEKYGVEKIKTIGDAYMAAGGLPVPELESVKHTVLAAIEMQRFIIQRKETQTAKGLYGFEMRVGIHSGPAVAGIVGVKKFQYDIWGDTVNTAARMESSGNIGKVNISQSTYEVIKDDPAFRFESRGKIEAKNKGQIEMYFVYMAND